MLQYSNKRASYFNLLLKYFRGYWETTKIFLSSISNNEIIPDKIFPDYGRLYSRIIHPATSTMIRQLRSYSLSTKILMAVVVISLSITSVNWIYGGRYVAEVMMRMNNLENVW